ncbi:MAG: hypothetical protein KDC54_07305 [Lewinella sp.]|nr:hypothetical protein [Lewinella sp.]
MILLLICAAVLFNFPIITLSAKMKLVGGVPQLYLYIFLVWFLIILAIGRLVHPSGRSTLPTEKEQ